MIHYVEKPETFVSNVINAGVYLFTPEVFKVIGETFQSNHADLEDTSLRSDYIHLERDILPKLARSGTFFAYQLSQDNKWCQIKNGG